MTPLLALLLAVAPPPPTGEWVPFDVPEQSGVSFYDSGTVERDGDLVRVWIRWNPQDEAAPFDEARVLSQIDCRARTGQILRSAVYDRDGGLIGRDDTPQTVDPIREGYAAHSIAQALCPRPLTVG